MNQHPIVTQQVADERHRQVRDAFAQTGGRIDGPRRRPTSRSAAVAAMSAGMAATVVATVVPYLDRSGLVRHIRAGYPDYSTARIDKAATTYLVYLSVLGVLGLVGWLWSVRVTMAGRWWAGGVAISMFLVGTGIALTDLFIKDTSGETGLPALIGWVGLLPSLPGLLTVVLLWRRGSA